MSRFPLTEFLDTIAGFTAEETVKAIVSALQWVSSGSYKKKIIDGQWEKQLLYFTDQFFAFIDANPERIMTIKHVFTVYITDPTITTIYNM